MSEVKKENEGKKKQGRKSEEGIIRLIVWKNIGGNKTTFSNRQLYNSFRLPVTLKACVNSFKQEKGEQGTAAGADKRRR